MPYHERPPKAYTVYPKKNDFDGGSYITTKEDNPFKYNRDPHLEEQLEAKLAKQETTLGRYHPITAMAYATLAHAVSTKSKDSQRAAALYRTQYRVELLLNGSKCQGPIQGAFRQVLCEQLQLCSEQIASIQTDLVQSTFHEREGDWYRRYGQRQLALSEYHKAARIEEASFGRENPDLTYCWRKMACLAAIQKRLTSSADIQVLLDFETADQINDAWMQQASNFLSPTITAMIRQGDEYYGKRMYSRAIGAYFQACSGALASVIAATTKQQYSSIQFDGSIRSNQSKCRRRHRSHSRQRERRSPTPTKVAEVEDGESDDCESNAENKASEWEAFHHEPSVIPVQIQKPSTSADRKEANITTTQEKMAKWRSPLSVKATITSGSLRSGTRTNFIEQQSQESDLDEQSTTNPTFEMEVKESNASTTEVPQQRKPPRPSSSSNSIFRSLRKFSSNRSLMGGNRAKKGEDEEDLHKTPSRPKSESYLSRVRRKTKKMAKKPQKLAKKVITKVRTTANPLQQGDEVNQHSVSRPPVSPETTVMPDAEPAAAPLAYGKMLSPPMTPFPPANKSTVTTSTREDPRETRGDIDGIEEDNFSNDAFDVFDKVQPAHGSVELKKPSLETNSMTSPTTAQNQAALRAFLKEGRSPAMQPPAPAKPIQRRF